MTRPVIRAGRLNAHAEHVPARGGSGWVPEDPDDDKFIDAVMMAGGTIIVSGNRHLVAPDTKTTQRPFGFSSS